MLLIAVMVRCLHPTEVFSVLFREMSLADVFFFFQSEDGIRELVRSRRLGDVYKRQHLDTEKKYLDFTKHADAAADYLEFGQWAPLNAKVKCSRSLITRQKAAIKQRNRPYKNH